MYYYIKYLSLWYWHKFNKWNINHGILGHKSRSEHLQADDDDDDYVISVNGKPGLLRQTTTLFVKHVVVCKKCCCL